MENKPQQHLLTAEATPDAITGHSYLDKVRGLGSIGEERQAQLLHRNDTENSQAVAAVVPEVPQPTPAEIAAQQASLASTEQKSAAEKLAAVANTQIDRNVALKKFDDIVNPDADAPKQRARFLDKIGAKRIGTSLLLAAGLATGIGSAPAASSEDAPRDSGSIEQVDPGVTPFKSEEAKATATFGTPEYNTQKQFGEAERSWQVEGKLSADKVGKPMNTETTDTAFADFINDARTNADVFAQAMIGCSDKLDCRDMDKLAAKYDAASPEEREKMYGELTAKTEGSELEFETWDNYGTTFTNTETKSVNWNNDRRTDGVKILRVTLPTGEVFYVVTECEQLAFQPEQAEQKKLHELPVLGAAVAVETASEAPNTPAPNETTPTTDTPDSSETPSEETPTPEEEDNPTDEETTTPEEENPEEEEEGNEEKPRGGAIDDNPDMNEQVDMGDDRVEAGELKPATQPTNPVYDPVAAAEQQQENAEELEQTDESVQENPAGYEPAPVVNDGRSTVDMTDPTNIPGEQTDATGNVYTVDANGNVINNSEIQE